MKKIKINHSIKFGKLVIITLIFLSTTAMALGGVLAYIMTSNVTVNIAGVQMEVNDNPVPYDETLTVNIEAGTTAIYPYTIENLGPGSRTVLLSTTGFTCEGLTIQILNNEEQEITNIGIEQYSTADVIIKVTADPWIESETITGQIHFDIGEYIAPGNPA
jgi:hypothetical protein